MSSDPHGPSAGWSAGGCHCGAIRFGVRVRSLRVNACNCSICSMKGFLGLIVQASDFELRSGTDQLIEYRFNTGTAVHNFCRVCGIHPFSKPRSHPDGFDVNIRCLDEKREDWEFVSFDGQNWEESVDSIRKP